jgi:hypothetical protein
MIEKFAGMKAQLSELAIVLNEFNPEAVQLRLLDLVFGKEQTEDGSAQEDIDKSAHKAPKRRAPKTKKLDSTAPEKRKKATVGAGANATLTQLLSGNFFDKPRTINDIIEHCKHNLARTFKANEFSGKLGRIVRSGDLTRKKNADNQYEYKKA